MTNRVLKGLKRAFDLPRHPKRMSKEQRALYRSLKTRYSKLPSDARRMFCDNVSALMESMTVQST